MWNFLYVFFHSIILSDLQRATKTLRWLRLGLFSLHTYTVGSALMTVYYFALQEKYLVDERRRSKCGSKESFQRASNRANINIINNSNNRPLARTHTHTPTHILYILASQLEPLSLEDASNPNILAIEEDISIKILKMEHLISLNV